MSVETTFRPPVRADPVAPRGVVGPPPPAEIWQSPDYRKLALQLSELSDVSWREAVSSLITFHLETLLTEKKRYLTLKRLLDIAGSALGLLLLAVPLSLVALTIRLTSKGPALFVQHRYAQCNHIIRVYKFRTMVTQPGGDQSVCETIFGDPRITPIGRFLRKWYIDELPQLWNVLKGDMSLVGPRAHPVGMQAGGLLYEELVPVYSARHVIRPGLTGLAQSRGLRGETRDAKLARERVACDLEYIANISFVNDMRIIAETFRYEVLVGTGY